MQHTTVSLPGHARVRLVLSQGLALTLLVFCATGCGQHRASLPDSTTPSVPAATQPSLELPALPDATTPLSMATRNASSLTVNGDSYAQAGGGNTAPVGNSALAVIPGGDDEYAYALYNVPGITADRPVSLTVNSTLAVIPGGEDGLPLTYWVGIANYTTYRWEWHGPLTKSASFPLNSADERDRYVSATGTAAYVVMTYGDAPKTPANPQGLNGVTIQTSVTTTSANYVTNLPHYTLIDDLGAGNGKAGSSAGKQGSAGTPLDPDTQYVTIKWKHVAAFNPDDEQNSAFQYQIFRQGPFDQYPVNIGSELAPEEVYVDPLDNASVSPPPIPGVTYSYFVRAVNPSGYTPLSPAGRIKIPLLPPANLAASDGVFDDKVRLLWTKAAGASAYEIYRAPSPDPIAVVGDVNVYYDLAVPDTEQHFYTVKSRNPFSKSSFSKPDPGSRRQAIQSFDLMTGDAVNGPTILMCKAAFNPVTNLPVASYTVDQAMPVDDATYLYEYDAANGWVQSKPLDPGSFAGSAPADLCFKPNGDLAFGYGNIANGYDTEFALRPAGQGVGPAEQVWSTGGGAPVHLHWSGSEFGMVYIDYGASPYVINYSHGTPGNFQTQTGTPQVNSASWNYDFAFDSFGDPYMAYVDGEGSPLNIWWLTNGTWNITTLDPGQCYGVNIAAGQDGKMFILYQWSGQLRLAEGKIDKQTFESSFIESPIEDNLFLGFLSYYCSDLAVDSQNQPHIIYPTDTLTDGDEKMWYRYRDAQGWAEPYQLDQTQTYIEARKCSIALDSHDRPLCVFAHEHEVLRAVWFK